MFAILVVGLNLAGALATSSYYPRQQLLLVVANNLSAPLIAFPDEHGLTYVYRARGSERREWRMSDSRRGWRISEVIRNPVPPTLLEIWSPVMASVSVSLFMLLVPSGQAAPWRRGARIDPDRSGRFGRRSRRLIGARVIAIVLALVLLNVSGAVSGTRPGRSYVTLKHGEFFGGTPRILVFRMEGTTVQSRPMNGSDWLGPVESRSGTLDDAGYDLDEATIEYRRDASIVTYAGMPERKLSQPVVISPPARSFLDVWWPLIATSSVTVVVIVLLWRGIRRDFCGRSDTPAAVTSS
jgi:hypothetical protein